MHRGGTRTEGLLKRHVIDIELLTGAGWGVEIIRRREAMVIRVRGVWGAFYLSSHRFFTIVCLMFHIVYAKGTPHWLHLIRLVGGTCRGLCFGRGVPLRACHDWVNEVIQRDPWLHVFSQSSLDGGCLQRCDVVVAVF